MSPHGAVPSELAVCEPILAVHLLGKPVASGVELGVLAEQTAGMSAAETRFVCDRAAMNALRRVFPSSTDAIVDPASVLIGQTDFDEALAKDPRSAKASGALPPPS